MNTGNGRSMLCRPEGARASERMDRGFAPKWGARRMRIAQIRTGAPAGFVRSRKSGLAIEAAPSAFTARGRWRSGDPVKRIA